MNIELQRIARQLEQAQQAEEVFGDLGSQPSEQAAHLRNVYHRLAKLTHPDAHSSRDDKKLAESAFNRLTEWYNHALARLQAGIYGTSSPLMDWQVVLQAKKHTYVLAKEYQAGPLYVSYPGIYQEGGIDSPVTIKIIRDPANNGLAENEASVLKTLAASEAARKLGNYLPCHLESFYYDDGGVVRWVNVFERQAGWVSLSDVKKAFPRGLNAQEVSWIWRRVLTALGFAHRNGFIHGAVLPANIEILPDLHGLRLTEWSCAVRNETGEPISVINPAYQRWYPREVLQREAPLTGTDIDMAARCMINLLGGDPLAASLPASVPAPLRAFFRGCTLPGKRSRPQDAWALKNEYEELIDRLWGRLKFRPFVMHPINQ